MLMLSRRSRRFVVCVIAVLLIINQFSFLTMEAAFGAEGSASEESAEEDLKAAAEEPEEVSDSGSRPSEEVSDGSVISEDGSPEDTEGEDVAADDDAEKEDEDGDVRTVRGPPEEEPVLRASNGTKAGSTGSFLAFTSDVHNQSDNISANRLGVWLDTVGGMLGGIDYMGFCGDMGDAGGGSRYWTYTQNVIDQVSARDIPACYTTGNHEYSHSDNASTFTPDLNATTRLFTVDAAPDNLPENANYSIYALGSMSGSQAFTNEQISHLETFLSNADADKPIIVLAHFPLHYATGYGNRTTQNAIGVINAMNNAAAEGKTVIFLWGHNHTLAATSGEPNYDQIFNPGDSIRYTSGASSTIQFYYGAAGCMSDSTYSSGSAAVKGKGLIIQVRSDGSVGFGYFNENGQDVTEAGDYPKIILDPVAVTGISIDQTELSVREGRTKTLTATVKPSNATDKTVVWSSSDTSVATVDERGKVKGVSPGTATITAQAGDEENGIFTDSIEITVTERTTDKDYYVIMIGNYALSSVRSSEVYNNASYQYHGMEAVKYTAGDPASQDIVWTLEPAGDSENSFYIRSYDGEYLSSTYVANGSGWAGDLTVGDVQDVWTIDGDTDTWTINGSYLKSENGSINGRQRDIYLTYRTSNNNVDFFTVGSSSSYKITTLTEPEQVIKHDWGFDGFKWTGSDTDGYTQVSAKYTCKNDSSHTRTVEAELDIETKAPTCTEAGSTTYTATIGAEASLDGELHTESIVVEHDALGHTPGSAVKENEVAATCEEEGSYDEVIYCTVCNEEISREKKTVPAAGHKLEMVAGKLPTCMETGIRLHYVCGVCGKHFKDEAGLYSLAEEDAILPVDPEAHDWDEGEITKEPTCTEEGVRIYHCKNNNEHTKTETVEMIPHTEGEPVRENEVAATCEEAGSYDEVIYCTVCNEEISRETISVPATGHEYEFKEFIWTGNTAKARYVCKNNDAHEGTVEATIKSSTEEAGCETEGSTTYTATVSAMISLDKKTHTDTKTVVIPALGHDWEFVGFSWTESDEEGYTATADYRCSRDGSHTDTLEAHMEVTTTEAECEKDGSKVYEASVSAGASLDKEEHSDTKAVTIPATGHDWDEGEITKEPTCSEEGVRTYHCKNDSSHTKTEAVEKIPHTEGEPVHENEVAATCEEAGSYDEVIYCTVCNEEISRETISVPATGHDYEFVEFQWKDETAKAVYRCKNDESHTDFVDADMDIDTTLPGCETEGSTVYTATVSAKASLDKEAHSDTKTVTIPAEGHKLDKVEKILPTCTDTGMIEHYVCSVCGKLFRDEEGQEVLAEEDAVIPTDPEAHDWDEGEITKEPTCTEEGVRTYHCKHNSKHTKTEAVEKIAHTEGEPVRENEVAATCEEAGSYDEVIYCTFCKEELSRETKTTPATGHDWDEGEITKEPTCTEEGVRTYHCKNDSSHTRTEAVEKIAHTPGEPVHENEVPATCEEAGSYDEVIYCTFCKEELSRETKTTPAIGHDFEFIEFVFEGETAVASYRCKNDASHVRTVNAVVRKKTTAATCEEDGSIVYTASVYAWSSLDRIAHSGTNTVVIPAKGHDWKFTEFTWDGHKATANYVCKNDASHVNTADAEVESVTTDPGCETEGSTVYTATVSAETSPDGSEHSDTLTEVIPATGHEWEFEGFTWTGNDADGYTKAAAEYVCKNAPSHTKTADAKLTVESEDATCTVPGTVTYTATVSAKDSPDGQPHTDSRTTESAALGHKPGSAVRENEVKASCIEDGSYDEVIYCTVCKEELNRETKVIPATGHTYGEPIYEWLEKEAGYDCKATSECILCDESTEGHVVTEKADGKYSVTKEPACEEEGSAVYTAEFTNLLFTPQIKQVTIPATGHEWKFESFKWTGNDADGYTKAAAEYVCTNEPSHTKTADAKLDVETEDATCTIPGTVTYTATVSAEDSPDGELHTDVIKTESTALGHRPGEPVHENEKAATCEETGSYDEVVYCTVCKEELSREARVIPAKGHDYEFVEFIWTDDTARAAFRCRNDESHEKVIEAEVTEETYDPGCETEGKTVYTATVSAGESPDGTEHTEAKTKVIPATGHDYEFVEFTWTDDTAKASYKCRNDGSHVVTAEAEVTCVTTVPGCETEGSVVYTAIVSAEVSPDGAEHTDTRTEVIAAAGHKPEAVTGKLPTCTEAGIIPHFACSVCGKLFRDEAGLEVLTQEDTIMPIDPEAHEWDEGEITTEATCAKEGVKTYHCKHNSEHTKTEAVEKTAHTPMTVPVHENEVAATCEEAGSYDEVIYCKVCGEELSRTSKTTEKLEHSFGEYVLTRPAKPNKSGLWTRTCTRCGAVETKVIPPTKAKAKCKSGKKVKISWTKVPDAERYVVYLSKCNSKFKLIKKTKKLFCTKGGLKSGVCYKFKVVAQKKVGGKWTMISQSYVGHFAAGDLDKVSKTTNPKSISVSRRAVTVGIGQSVKIRAKIRPVKAGRKLLSKRHAAVLRYVTDDFDIAAIDKKGRVTGKKAGVCRVYVIGVNGLYKAVRVTVK